MNLLSVRKLESIGYSVLFEDGKAKIEKGELLLAVAYRKRKLYELEFERFTQSNAMLTEGEKNLWHNRMGHMSSIRVRD